jgi:hypothetical protein
MTGEILMVGIAPAVLVGSLVWRLSARLSLMDAKLDRLEMENRQLRSDLAALQTLLRLLVDRGRPD